MRRGFTTRSGAIVAAVAITGIYLRVVKSCRFPRSGGMTIVALLSSRNMGRCLPRRGGVVMTTVTHAFNFQVIDLDIRQPNRSGVTFGAIVSR